MSRLAVLIPCFNGQARLEKTLEGLKDEPVPVDVFVVDDGSEPPITLGPTIGPHPLLLRRLPRNAGIETALNTGLDEILRGGYDFVARMDVGDTSLPGRFQAQIAFLEEHADVAIVGSACDVMDTSGKLLFHYAPPTTDAGIRKALRYANCIVHPTMMIRVSALREIGTYRREYPAAEDYDLVLRLASRFQVANLPQPFLQIEADPNGISRQRRRRQILSRLRLEVAAFDPRDLHSYSGIVLNAAALAIPNRLIVAAKRLLPRVPV